MGWREERFRKQGSERFNLKVSHGYFFGSTLGCSDLKSLSFYRGICSMHAILQDEELICENNRANTHTCTHTYKDTHLQHSRSCTHDLQAHAHKHTRTHTHTAHTCMHTHKHAHAQIHTHRYTRVYIHIRQVCINTYRRKAQLYKYIYKSTQCVMCIWLILIIGMHTREYTPIDS